MSPSTWIRRRLNDSLPQPVESANQFILMKMSFAFVGLFAAIAALVSVGGHQLFAAENDTKAPQYIYIAGEVNVPNKYVYSDDLTLGKALKLAKGVTSKASDQITLTRQGSDKQTFTLKEIEKGDAANIKLKPDHKIFVPRKE